MKLHPRYGRTLLGHLGRPHSPHHGPPRRCRRCTQWFQLRCRCPSMMCTPSSTASATMGHWGQWLLTPWPPCLTDPTHPTMAALGVANTVLSDSNCSLGVLCDDVHRLGPPWGSRRSAPSQQGRQGPPCPPCLTGPTHPTFTPHHGPTRRCRHLRFEWFELRFGWVSSVVSFGGAHIIKCTEGPP
jgi:hypothetical protein